MTTGQFASEIQEQMSPVLSFFAQLGAAIVIFVGLGQMLTKQMMKKMGGPNSMMFGAGQIQREGLCEILGGHQVYGCGR